MNVFNSGLCETEGEGVTVVAVGVRAVNNHPFRGLFHAVDHLLDVGCRALGWQVDGGGDMAFIEGHYAACVQDERVPGGDRFVELVESDVFDGLIGDLGSPFGPGAVDKLSGEESAEHDGAGLEKVFGCDIHKWEKLNSGKG